MKSPVNRRSTSIPASRPLTFSSCSGTLFRTEDYLNERLAARDGVAHRADIARRLMRAGELHQEEGASS
jgi:hypothetical protein